MHGMHKNFGALAQHFAGRGHTVGYGEQVAGDTQQHFRIALHGRHGRQQVQQAAPTAQWRAAHGGPVALIESPFGGGQQRKNGHAHFWRGIFQKSNDFFADIFFGVLCHRVLRFP